MSKRRLNDFFPKDKGGEPEYEVLYEEVSEVMTKIRDRLFIENYELEALEALNEQLDIGLITPCTYERALLDLKAKIKRFLEKMNN